MIDPIFIGLWSEDIMYGPGAQSEEVIVFKADGTGWIEDWNFILCSAEFFHWDVPELNFITILGDRRLELDDGNANFVEVEPSLNRVKMPFCLQSEETPSGKMMQVLRMPFWPRYRDEWCAYGFDEHGELLVREPQAGPINRKSGLDTNSIQSSA